MPFLSLLQVIKDPLLDTNEEGAPWVLVKPLIYRSDLLGKAIVVPTGFRTDFASVPRWPLAFMLTGDIVHEPAVVHDWLIVSKMVSRKMADKIFLEAMAEDGVAPWRRKVMFFAVHGYTHWLEFWKGPQ